jgi:hypothetical protein
MFWLLDNKLTSGVTPSTAFVVMRVPPGAGTNSLFVAKISCAELRDRAAPSGQAPSARRREMAVGTGGFIEMDAKSSCGCLDLLKGLLRGIKCL